MAHFSPVHAQNANPYTMACRDCIYREKDTIVLNRKLIQVGIMRGTCMIYDGKSGNWKPNNVYFRDEDCEYYKQDKSAPRFWEGQNET